jgi:DNA-binding MarR family transcriptional regulator
MMLKNAEGGRQMARPEQIVGFLLKSLHHTLRQIIDEALRKQGVELSFAQLAALFGLHGEPGITGAQLARRAFVSAQTMNSVLHRLELEGRIERRPHPDSRRADSWSLTPAGLEELERARCVGEAVFKRMLSPMTDAEVASFQDFLQRSIAALGGDAAHPESPLGNARRPTRRFPRRRASAN